MKTTIALLQKHPQVSDYKINIHQRESYELFYVKGKLETVRCTDTCDKEVTVYVNHGDFKGDAQFFVYPSTTEQEIAERIDEAVAKALLINNKNYVLPDAAQGDFVVESNFADYAPMDLAALVANTVFSANTVENADLNSVEVFITKHTKSVLNSRGLHKNQVSYDAMVEAIPTYNGSGESVELYEQHNFGSFDAECVRREIAEKMAQVKARYEAVKPDFALDCKVILNKLELDCLFSEIASDLDYAAVYMKSNLFKKGDMLQKAPVGDKISITMAGEAAGSVNSAKFDGDGMSLGSICIVDAGKVVNYHGSNRLGQYVDEEPTGVLGCVLVAPGSAEAAQLKSGTYLEVISMSGLQVDLNNDYIGGEIRLAYYCDGEKEIPVTGVSFSGAFSDVMNHIRLSKNIGIYDGYVGPEQAALTEVKIF